MHWKALLFVLAASVSFAQDTSSRAIFVDVVNNKTQLAVDDLKAENFKVTVNGRAVSVVAAERKQIRPKVTVVLDASGSMVSPPLWDVSFELAADLVEKLAGTSYLSFVVFGDKVERVITWKSGTQAMLRELAEDHNHTRQQIGHGRTQLRDAMLAGIAHGGLGFGDAMVVITDGGDNSSHITDADFQKLLSAKGIRTYGVLLMRPPSLYGPTRLTPEEQEGRFLVETYAKDTGGFCSQVQQYKQTYFEALAEQITRRIASPIRLQLSIADSEAGKLSVKYLQNGKPAKRVQVIYAEKLPPGLTVRGDTPAN